jgi:hypothetical protein
MMLSPAFYGLIILHGLRVFMPLKFTSVNVTQNESVVEH